MTRDLNTTLISYREYETYFKPVIGDMYWNDAEGIVCIPVDRLSGTMIKQIQALGCNLDTNWDYIVCEF